MRVRILARQEVHHFRELELSEEEVANLKGMLDRSLNCDLDELHLLEVDGDYQPVETASVDLEFFEDGKWEIGYD